MLKLSGNSAHGSRLAKYGRYSPVKANGLMRAQKLSGNSTPGSRLEKYGRYSPVKANGLMCAQELSGNFAHGFREGKAVFRPQAVLAAMHEPPRSHEPHISVSARPYHWHLTNRFSLSHSLLRFNTRHGV